MRIEFLPFTACLLLLGNVSSALAAEPAESVYFQSSLESESSLLQPQVGSPAKPGGMKPNFVKGPNGMGMRSLAHGLGDVAMG